MVGWLVGVEERGDRYYRSAVSGGMMGALPKTRTGSNDKRGREREREDGVPRTTMVIWI